MNNTYLAATLPFKESTAGCEVCDCSYRGVPAVALAAKRFSLKMPLVTSCASARAEPQSFHLPPPHAFRPTWHRSHVTRRAQNLLHEQERSALQAAVTLLFDDGHARAPLRLVCNGAAPHHFGSFCTPLQLHTGAGSHSWVKSFACS